MNKNYNLDRRKRKAFIFLLISGECFAVSGIVMCLWNLLLPDILHTQPINYWQAFGLFILSRILFGSFRFGGSGKNGFGPPAWRQKWMNMSEEEKTALKAKWREKCGPK